MKGVLFKYDADPNDSELKDYQSACHSIYCGIRDPDFWSNDVPVWGICGPYVRTNLEKGDMVLSYLFDYYLSDIFCRVFNIGYPESVFSIHA